MKTPRNTIAFAVGTAATLGLVGLAAFLTAADTPTTPLSERINIDSSPPYREGPLGGFAQIVEKVGPSVVSVSTSKALPTPRIPDLYSDPRFRRFFQIPEPDPNAPNNTPKQQGLGSGVILTADGYIVTNNHVIDGADEILVSLPDNKKRYEAEIIGQDPQTDLAILKIDESGLPTMTIADSSALKVGDTVLALGSPFGLSKTVTSGIVSALGRSNMDIIGNDSYENFIQTDAPINPGNSGGALVDNKGRLVGINTAILSRTGASAGIGFAIPTNLVMNIADQLIGTGEIQRGFLGVMLGELSSELAEVFQVPDDRGVLVQQVMPDTPAEAAGFREGDIIIGVDGIEARDVRQTRLAVSNKAPDTKVAFDIIRDGKEMTIKVTLCRLPSDDLASNLRSPGGQASSGESNAPSAVLSGVKVANLNDTYRRQLGLSNDIQGVVITQIDPNSDAAEKGAQRGDVITEIGRQTVENLSKAEEALDQVDGALVLVRVWRDNVGRFVALKKS